MIDILDFIPYGTDKEPVKRYELEWLTGKSDRQIREEIRILKRTYPIINVGDGYYIPNDPDDPNLEAYIRKEMHRIREISKGLRRHKRLWKINKDQEILKI